MLSTIRFWTNSHSVRSLLHDRNFTYYYSDILNNINSFVSSSNLADIKIIPKFNNNQVEMSFIISSEQLLKLKKINFSLKTHVLFCFLPLINFYQYTNDNPANIELEFWRIVDWEYIYFQLGDKQLAKARKGAITVYARKDIIYSRYKELAPTELFINRSTDFIPRTENLQLCSPVCAYGADVKTQTSKKSIKIYDKEVKDYETILVLNTSDETIARKFFSNLSVFWRNWVADILTFLPDRSYGDYWTLKRFYPSFRAHQNFGDLKYYRQGSGWYDYPVFTTDYNYFPYSSLSSSEGHIYYVGYNSTHITIETTLGGGVGLTHWQFNSIPLLPFDYKIYSFSGSLNTTKIKRGSSTSNSNKFFFNYDKGSAYRKITRAFSAGLSSYVNFDNFFEKVFIKTAKGVASALGLDCDFTQIEKTRYKSYGTTIKYDIGIVYQSSMLAGAPTVRKHDWKDDYGNQPNKVDAHFFTVKVYSTLEYSSSQSKRSIIFGSESPFKDHWDAAHIHKTLVGNRIGVFPLDRRYDYKESISGSGSNTIAIYNTDTSELRDIGNVNIKQMDVNTVNSIMLNVQKERERFNKLQAINNRHSLIRNIINTTSSIFDLPTIMKPNQDYWNPAPIKVDIPEDSIWEKTGWISEGMKRTGKRIPTLTKSILSEARTEYLQAAPQGLPLAFGGSFAAMGIRSVFRGAFATAQGWISSSMEREKAQMQMNLKEEQALNIAVNISSDLQEQFPWLSRDAIYLLEYTTGNKQLITKDRKRYGNFINEYKYFYEIGGPKNAYYSVNLENTDWAQLWNLTTTELEIFKVIMKNGIFFNPENLNKFASDELPQYVENFDNYEPIS